MSPVLISQSSAVSIRQNGLVWAPVHRFEKLISVAALLEHRSRLRGEGLAVVFTNGCFDLLHVGHVRCLEQARALGDCLVVGVNDDRSVRELKGPGRPIVPHRERMEVLAALTDVDFVVGFQERTPVELVRRLQPDHVCKGGDYAGADLPEAAEAAVYGGRLHVLDHTPGRSTSAILTGVVDRFGAARSPR
jgi:rfaE bifunctional protein nucleotidyltransferase chain/domain